MKTISESPVVSVVIPTRNRPALLVRAINSVLAQTMHELEILVIIDGVDPATVHVLTEMSDARVKWVALEKSVGGAEARNIGVQHGRGEFIALLDDDDEWHKDKLRLQVEAARSSTRVFPIVTCRLVARRPIGDEIWPSRPLRPNESMSDYLLSRGSSIRQGEGFIQSSTLLFPRQLMLNVPFQPGLARHQDWDWLIRVAAYDGVEFIWIWQSLVTYYIDGNRKSISSGNNLKPSVDWVEGNRLITPRARAYFYATQVAVRCASFATLCSVVRNTIRYPRAFLIAMGLALVPRNVVYHLRPRKVWNNA